MGAAVLAPFLHHHLLLVTVVVTIVIQYGSGEVAERNYKLRPALTGRAHHEGDANGKRECDDEDDEIPMQKTENPRRAAERGERTMRDGGAEGGNVLFSGQTVLHTHL